VISRFLGKACFRYNACVPDAMVSSPASLPFASTTGKMFWLASEDHDFTEINRIRLLADDGRIETFRFDWAGRGRAR